MQEMGLKIKNTIIQRLIPPIIDWNYQRRLSFQHKMMTPTYIKKFITNPTQKPQFQFETNNKIEIRIEPHRCNGIDRRRVAENS